MEEEDDEDKCLFAYYLNTLVSSDLQSQVLCYIMSIVNALCLCTNLMLSVC